MLSTMLPIISLEALGSIPRRIRIIDAMTRIPTRGLYVVSVCAEYAEPMYNREGPLQRDHVKDSARNPVVLMPHQDKKRLVSERAADSNATKLTLGNDVWVDICQSGN